MLSYVAQRVGVALVMVWLVATLVFLLLHIIPGDPAVLLLSSGSTAPDPQAVEALRRQLGLDQPITTQYADYIVGILQGDLGVSLRDGTPVAEQIARRLPRTLELIVAAAILAVGIGIPVGVRAATRAGGLTDKIASGASALALSTPVFVTGTLAILLFAQTLRIAPAGGYVPFADNPMRHLGLLILPASTVALPLCAVVIRMTRSAVLEVLERDFVRAVRARGVAPRRIMTRHVLRAALVPVVTVTGLELGTLLGGTVLVEFVYNWPGLSGFLVSAVEARDYPEVVGIVLTISALFVALNLFVDLLNAVLDPKVRLST
ncbi:MAG: ABC transporter permease [Pseudomonadota bacterium]